MEECDMIPGSVKLHFLESGVIVRPYEINTDSSRTHHSYARAVVSRPAAEHIAQNHIEAEPVNVTIGGVIQDRYFIPKDAVEMDKKTGTVELLDAIMILRRGVIQKDFPTVTLGDIMDYVIEHRDDPHGVITGVQHDSSISGGRTADWDGGYDQGSQFTVGDPFGAEGQKFNDILAGVNNVALEGVEWVVEYTTNIQLEEGGMYFDEVSPLRALEAIEKEFNTLTWVDFTGMVHYRQPEAIQSNLHSISENSDAYRLREVNVVEPAEKCRKAVLRGTVQVPGYNVFNGIENEDVDGKYIKAVAELPGEEGYTVAPEKPVDIHTPEALEAAAARRLSNEYSQQYAGNIVVNSIASTAQPALAGAQVGDVLLVDGSLKMCSPGIDVGGFIVTSVQQRMTAREPWKTTLGVAGIPPAPNVYSWVYETNEGFQYEDLEKYMWSNGPLDFYFTLQNYLELIF